MVLSYTITHTNSGQMLLNKESEILHGVLSTREKCTLIGKFNPKHGGCSFQDDLVTSHGKTGFRILILGDFLEDNELIDEINFSLTSMQEFFFPKGWKDLVRYSEKPLFSIDTKYGKLKVGTNASFGFLYEDITKQIYHRKQEALDDLKQSFEKIQSKHSDSPFMLKKDIAYRVSLIFNSGLTIVSAFDHILDIANLFSLLIYNPVHPDSIRAIKKKDSGSISISIYPYMVLNKSTVDLSLRSPSHHNMPIKKTNVDLATLITKWLESPKLYSTIVSSIQHNTGYLYEYSAYGEFVLYAAQLDLISHQESAEKTKKYEYAIDKYGTDKIRTGIKAILIDAGAGSNIEKGIAKIRTGIVHLEAEAPRKLPDKISMKNIVALLQCLQITILGYILYRLGISKNVISVYQDTFTPDLLQINKVTPANSKAK